MSLAPPWMKCVHKNTTKMVRRSANTPCIQRVSKTEKAYKKITGARSTSGQPRVPASGPGGRDIKLQQHLARVSVCMCTGCAASVGAIQNSRKNNGRNTVERTALMVWCGRGATSLPGALPSATVG